MDLMAKLSNSHLQKRKKIEIHRFNKLKSTKRKKKKKNTFLVWNKKYKIWRFDPLWMKLMLTPLQIFLWEKIKLQFSNAEVLWWQN